MDAQVTCPRCKTRQSLSGPDGYRCTSCGARWAFVRCRSCAGAFHMGAPVDSWVCPTCGTRNGPPAPGIAADPKGRRRSPFAGSERIPLIAVVIGAVIVVALVWLKVKPGSGAAPSTSSSPTTVLTAAEAVTRVCHDIPIDLNLRVEALTRTAGQVRIDAEAIKEAGDRATARKAVAVADAMANYATTLQAHGDTAADTTALAAAIERLTPSCTPS